MIGQRQLSGWIRERRRQRRIKELLRQTNTHVRLGAGEIEIGAAGKNIAVSVRQSIECIHNGGDGSLALELFGCPFILDNVFTSSGISVRQDQANLLVGPGDTGWPRGESLEYSFKWDPLDERYPSILLIPRNLPRTGFEEWVELPVARPRPGFRLIQDELSPSIVRFGIRASDPGEEASKRFINLTLVPEEFIAVEEGPSPVPIFTTVSLRYRLGRILIAEFTRLASESLAFLEGLFGPAPCSGVLFAYDDDRVTNLSEYEGPVFVFEEPFVRRYPSASFGLQFELTRELCGVYWGGGCAVVGENADELKSAIRAGVALAWSAEQGKPREHALSLRLFRDLARQSRLRDSWAALADEMRAGQAARWALAVYDRLLSSGGRRVFGNVTREFWSMMAPTVIIERELGLR